MPSKFKVWLHLEEIVTNEDGTEEDYIDADDRVLPLPVAICDTIDEAEDLMNSISEEHYQNYTW